MARAKRILLIFMFGCVPLVGAVLYCAYQGCTLGDVYLPGGKWNDEVVYYKQIEGIIRNGIPQGYFSYGENPARIGTFGAWSPIVMLPYVVIGSVFGWDYHMPIICNLLVLCVAFAFFAGISQTSWKCKFAIAMSYLLIPSYNRYALSGMSDAIGFAGIIFIVSLWFSNCKRKVLWLYVVCFFLTVIRPYYLILFVVPIYFDWKSGMWKRILGGSIAFVAISLYFAIYYFLCAPYFEPTISAIDFTTIIESIGKGFKEIFKNILACFREPNWIGEIYGLFVVLFILILVTLVGIYCYRGRLERRLCFILLYDFVMVLAIILLYDVNVGSRHLLPFILLNLFVLFSVEYSIILWITASILLLICIVIPKEDYTYKLSVDSGEKREIVDKRTENFEKYFTLESGISWNNTVIWVLGVDYNIFYSIPNGFGISICREYDIQNAETIKSKYIIIGLNTPCDEKLQKSYEEIYREDDFMVLRKVN